MENFNSSQILFCTIIHFNGVDIFNDDLKIMSVKTAEQFFYRMTER